MSPHTDRIRTTRKRVFVHSEEASACNIALSMSSGPYFGLVIYELVQRKRKALVTASKLSSSGEAHHYEILLVVEQLRRLPKISVVVRNVLSNARCSGGGVAQWLAILSQRSCGLRDFSRG